MFFVKIQDSRVNMFSPFQAQWFCPGCLSAAAGFGLLLSPQHPLPSRSGPGLGGNAGLGGAPGAPRDEAEPAAPVEPCAHGDHWSHDTHISSSTSVELKAWKLKI